MVLGVDPYLVDWLDLSFRFLHVIAAIVWIGTSFYFVALDNHLRPAEERDDLTGESWEIHGGGFYRIEKFRVTPQTIPEPLHWYKWEAYTTWLAGFALFVSLYYLQPRTYLIDASVADISPAVAIAASVALLGVGWLVYDLLCRTVGAAQRSRARRVHARARRRHGLRLSQLFAPRAAYLQVGAMLGTIMVANVFFVIIPAHWELIRAKEAGREPDPAAELPRQAALGAQQLPDAARAVRDALEPLRVHVLACRRVARARVADGDRRGDPALLQPAPPGQERLGDPGARGSLARRDRDLAPAARARPPPARRAVLAGERNRRRALCRLPLDAPDAARLLGAAARDRVRHARSRSRRAPPTSSSRPSS